MMVALCIPLFAISDDDYAALVVSLSDRTRYLQTNAPNWYWPVYAIYTIWFWGELVVPLTNRKRRALHDFLAGTVVVHQPHTMKPNNRWSDRES